MTRTYIPRGVGLAFADPDQFADAPCVQRGAADPCSDDLYERSAAAQACRECPASSKAACWEIRLADRAQHFVWAGVDLQREDA